MIDVAGGGQVERIRVGDPDTLEAIVRECLPGLLRSATAAGLPFDRAEDAVQSALMTFVQRASDFDGRARPSTWIHGILIRKIMEHRRDSHATGVLMTSTRLSKPDSMRTVVGHGHQLAR